eukprot:11068667-Ditylum_brightwellii.AAC.1
MKNHQAAAGINAGYKEIVKLSLFLLNVPALFAAFTDPKYGPPLSRADVNIVEESETNWMGYQFDYTWGVYNQQNKTDDGMRELIRYNKANVCHYFRQFGFGCLCIKDDLKNLTPYNVELETLMYFKDKYPVLFEVLDSKFCLMPSATRIVEQKHVQLRYLFRLGIGHDLTNAQQQYITNVDYEYRERRRVYERKRSNRAISKGYSVVKHDDGKSLQFQMAVDLVQVGELYTREAIARAPQEVQDKTQVSEVSKERNYKDK